MSRAFLNPLYKRKKKQLSHIKNIVKATKGGGDAYIATGGCQGTDVAAMYFAACKQIPFVCILPSFHPMKDDFEMGRYFELWRIPFVDNCHPQLIRGK